MLTSMYGWLFLASLCGCHAFRPSCYVDDLSPRAIGDNIWFCVFLSTRPARKMVFQIKVDEAAELRLQGSREFALENLSQPLYTWVTTSIFDSTPADPLNCSDGNDIEGRGHGASCPQIYAQSTAVSQLTNLVVNMQNGEVTSFAWDNTCSGCSPSKCLKSSRSLSRENYTEGSQFFSRGTCGEGSDFCVGTPAACNLKVFVTFAGTDKFGRNLLSAGSRLSKLAGPTLSSLYNTLKDGYAQASQALGK